jgi:hypothetical protein
MARVEGFYWVRERDEGEVLIALYRSEEWTFGDGEPFDDETNLDVVAGPLLPPSAEVTATWKQRYDEILRTRKRVSRKDPTAGWDYLPGYYWVRLPDAPEPILAQYYEGWGAAADEGEFDKVEIMDGPIPPPQVAKRQTA